MHRTLFDADGKSRSMFTGISFKKRTLFDADCIDVPRYFERKRTLFDADGKSHSMFSMVSLKKRTLFDADCIDMALMLFFCGLDKAS